MKKWRKIIVASVCSVTLASCSQPTVLVNQEDVVDQKEVQLTEKEQIPKGFFPVELEAVAIGDSLTEGIGDESKKGGYVPFIEQYIAKQNEVENVTISNLGKKGNRTDQLLARLKDPSIASKVSRADMIYVTIGGNDVMKVVRDYFYDISIKTFETEKSKYEKRLNEVFQRIRKLNPNAHIYLIGFYNPFFKTLSDMKEINVVIDEWNQASQQVAMNYENVTYVKIDDVFYDSSDNLLGKDEFHPNKKGYELMAERISDAMEEEDPLLGQNKEKAREEELNGNE
ncbi:GDSL family lipase [Bacillus sp. VT 712]|uniref:GDSL family lipase n=1 Tax=Priestia veravalensis TaxID=1414648 RepID=A0A0V8JPN0_9BACI|nr:MULTISPECIES: SGNH/GDSL hydrolase family protein [Bacillaceae]KSU88995.1 GDSL family lipase [Priestia veravalensis]KZB91508.1 GDSL family lipase [Bacillus sp. VT 712]SCB98409.1 Lysophospholipase L1 [Priestia flexa]